jgi:glycosyltransferase involved in cell wall biosynthesis
MWRALGQDPDIDLHVYFGSDFSVRGYLDRGFGVQVNWDVPLTAGYKHTFLSTNQSINNSDALNLASVEFRQHMLAFRPDVALLSGYSPFAFYLKAFLVLRQLSIPIIFRADATDDAVARSSAKQLARHVFLRVFYGQVQTVLAVGRAARRHYLSKGVRAVRIGWSPFSIDSEFLETQYEYWLPQRTSVRYHLGFTDDQPVFIFSGKLIPVKDPFILVTALQNAGAIYGSPVGVIVMGDGPLRKQLETELAIVPGVKTVFAGFQNQGQLGRFYSAADCLILPSRSETWGLVVNEALQYGLPAIVSDRVGCRQDLIDEGRTGFVFPAGNAALLADRMCWIIKLLETQRPMVEKACRQKAQAYSLANAVAGVRAAVLA